MRFSADYTFRSATYNEFNLEGPHHARHSLLRHGQCLGDLCHPQVRVLALRDETSLIISW